MCAGHKAGRSRRPVTAWFGTGAVATGVHIGLWQIGVPFAAVIAILEAELVSIVILTALFASPHFSDRAFRLLPWAASTESSQRRGHASVRSRPGA